ncbi:MAG: RNA polymerase sigma factor [Vicinamibacterales bacterium]
MADAGRATTTRDRHAAAVDAAFGRSQGARWGVDRDTFAAAVARAVAARFGEDGEAAAVSAFIGALHAEDLALACACRDGHGEAWDHFVLTYRPELYRAARAIAGEQGRELADSIYAELFGLTADVGERRSLFRYYHGRARLTTWLRSVLAQRHVDAVRAARRLTSLDDAGPVVAEPAAHASTSDPDTAARMRTAAACVSAALATLEAEARLRLAYYYVHGLTLAATGQLFGEHEATASRKLERARSALRTAIERELAAHGLGAADVDSWGEVATQAWDGALDEALAVAAPKGLEAQGTARPSFKGKRTP